MLVDRVKVNVASEYFVELKMDDISRSKSI